MRKRIAMLKGRRDCPSIKGGIGAFAKKAIHEKNMEALGIEVGT